MSDLGGDEVRLDVETDLDEGQARQQADVLAGIFEQAFAQAAPQIGARIAREFSKAFKNSRLKTDLGGTLNDAADEAVKSTQRISNQFEALGADTQALNARIDAMRATLRSAGADEGLFAVIDRELKVLLSNARRVEDQLARGITPDPDQLNAFQVAFQRANQTIFREVAGIQSVLRNLTNTQRIEGQRLNAAADRQAQERLQNSRLANSRAIVEEQGRNALLLAETRAAGQQQLAAQQATARRRIEIARFAFQQIRVFERSIAQVLSVSGRLAATAASQTASALGRIGGLFRRSNREINDGLNGALIQRERSIGRSFDRQTLELRQSVTEQSRILDRFERQASTGIVGAATGRSRLGGLLGGGLAIGGGFVLARQLREGFEETVNLNEALNRSEQIFGQASATIEEFAQNSVEALFITRSQAVAAASDFGIFARAAGLTGDELSGFSTTLTSLATDLASFNNTSVDDAITAVGAALRGESEPIRRYGVLLNEAVLQNRALAEGIIQTKDTLTPSQRVLAAYSEILAQTTAAQGDAARTADDFANSSRRAQAALTETFAALTRSLVPAAEFVTNNAFPILQNFTRFIEGDVSPALEILRDGLIGAAIALGGLLAFRVAGEAVQFFGLALRGALSPLGFLIVSIAAAGAAIRIFSQRSERFAEVMGNVVQLFRDLVSRGVALALTGLRQLANLITTVVLPAVTAFAEVVGRVLLTGVSIVAGIIISVLIPAVQTAASLFTNTVIPAVLNLATALRRYLVPALVLVGAAFLTFVSPLTAAIVALAGFAAVLIDLNTDIGGPLGAIISTFAGFARDVGNVFVSIATNIYAALEPLVSRAVGFISNAFRNIDYGAIAASILEVVRIIGFILGSIVSDPLFIKALAGIVIAAVAVGAKFIQGFIQGVISNLPELRTLLASAFSSVLSAAFEFALDNALSVIVGALLAVFIGQAVLGVFSRSGERGAQTLISSFARSVRTGATGLPNTLRGLVGGPNAFRSIADQQAAGYGDQLRRSIQRENRKLAALGGTGVNLVGGASQEKLDEARRRVGDLRGAIGEAGTEALLFRRRFQQAMTNTGTVARGAGQIISGNLAQGIRSVRTGLGGIRTAISDAFADAGAAGYSAGQVIGAGLMAGVGAALSGNLAGSSLASGSTAGALSGLGGIIASALAVSTIPGVGLALAGVTLAVGGLTTALSFNAEQAKKARAEIDEYVEAALRAENIQGLAAATAQTVIANLRDESDAVRDILESAGFDAQEFADSVVAGTFTARDAFAILEAGIGDFGDSFRDDFLGSLDNGVPASAAFEDAVNKNLDAVQELGFTGAKDLGVLFDTFGALNDESSELRDGLDLAAQLQGFGRNIQEVSQSTDDLVGSADRISSAFTTGSFAVDQAMRDIDGSIGGAGSRLRALLNSFGIDISDLGIDLEEVTGIGDGFIDMIIEMTAGLFGTSPAFKTVQRDLGEMSQGVGRALSEINGQNLDPFAEDLEDIGASIDLVGEAIRSLENARTTRIQGQIDQLQTRLEGAEAAADRARDALTSFITGRYADTAQAQVDQLIGQLGSIGSTIEEGILQGGVRGDAAVRSAVGGFEASIASIVQAGFDQGIRSQSDFQALLSPLFAALDEEVGDSASRILSTVDFTEGITPGAGAAIREALNRALSGQNLEVGANAIMSAEAEVRRIQSQLDLYSAELDVKVNFSLDQIRQALIDAGAGQALLDAVTEQGVQNAQAPALNQAVTNASSAAGGGVAVNQTLNQTNETNISVNGAKSPSTVASAVIDAQNASIAGAGTGTFFGLGGRTSGTFLG